MSDVREKIFILHRRPYRNTSLILNVLTRSYGRISLMAKGAMQARSPLSGCLNPFIAIDVQWSGRSDMKTLKVADPVLRYDMSSREKLYCGFYLNEIIVRLVHEHDPHGKLFELYEEALTGLAGGYCFESVLRRFEVKFLQEIGYGLNLEYEITTGQTVDDEIWYDYQPESGPVEIANGKSLGICVSGRCLRALANDQLDSADIRLEAKRFMRFMLNYYLGGRPLRSRELFPRNQEN